MSVNFNPFEPAIVNVLIPLKRNLTLPYTTLVDGFIKPTYSSIRSNAQSYEEGVEKFNSMIKATALIAKIAVFFFLYQKAWNSGTHYFGVALGPFVGGTLCAVIYGIGCTHLDRPLTNICTVSWLHYRGSISLIESLGTNREGALAALLISSFLGANQVHFSLTDQYYAQQYKAAEWLAERIYGKPLSKRSDNGETVNGAQNLSNGKSS